MSEESTKKYNENVYNSLLKTFLDYHKYLTNKFIVENENGEETTHIKFAYALLQCGAHAMFSLYDDVEFAEKQIIEFCEKYKKEFKKKIVDDLN